MNGKMRSPSGATRLGALAALAVLLGLGAAALSRSDMLPWRRTEIDKARPQPLPWSVRFLRGNGAPLDADLIGALLDTSAGGTSASIGRTPVLRAPRGAYQVALRPTTIDALGNADASVACLSLCRGRLSAAVDQPDAPVTRV
jgi:hypothetical protein